MMANALIDIPSIRRIGKLENVPGRRHSTGKVIMPTAGLTVLSRYLRASQGSCHDMCKYGTGFSPEPEPKILRTPMRKIFASKRLAGRKLERVSESNLGGRRKSEISGNVSPDCKIQESDDPVVINIEQTQGRYLANVEEDLTDTNNSKVGVDASDDDPVAINIAQTQERHLENVDGDLTDTKNSKVRVEPSNDDPVVINIAPTQGHHLANIEEDLTDTKNSKVRVEPSNNDHVAINIAQTQERHLENVDGNLTETKNSKVRAKPSNDDPVVISIAPTQGHHLESVEEDLTETKNSKFGVDPSDNDPVVINIAQTTQEHHLRNVEEDLPDTMNNEVSVKPSNDGVQQSQKYPAIRVKPSCEDSDDIEGEAEYEENAETKSLRAEKNPQVCMKPSPVDPKCVEGDISSWTDKGSVSPQQVLLSLEETDYAVAHAKDSKPKLQSKSSSHIRQACSSPKRKEAIIKSMTGVSGGRNKGEMTISKRIRTSMIGDKKNVVEPSVSLSPQVSNPNVPSMNAKTKKFRNVNRSKKRENAKQVKSEKLRDKNAKRSDNVKVVSHLMSLKNIKKVNSEQAKSANTFETTSYLAESNTEHKPAESDQNNVVSIRPSSSSKDKNMNRNQNRTPIVQEPRSYEKKNMIYKPKGNHAGGLPPSLSSFPGRKSMKPTPNGLNITQPSLASSSSLMSSHNDTSVEHDKAVVEKQKCSPKMMYKARSKKALMITPNNKHLPGKTLNFQRGKVFEIPVEDCTPRRLTFKKRELVDNRIYDNRKGKFEDFSPRRLKFRQRANFDNINADNQNGRVEEFTPRRLKFRRREIDGKRGGDNQNSRIEEFTPRRLKFRRREIDGKRGGDDQNSRIEEFSPRRLEFRRKLIVDNINGDNQNGNVEVLSPRRLEFRRKLIVDNINGDNQNGNVEEFSPRKLGFRRKLIVDNINSDNQYGRVEVYSPRRLELSRSLLDNRNADDQNGSGENYSPRKLIFRPKVVDKKINYIQNTKGSPTKKKIGRKEADVACNTDTKMQSEKISLRHRDVTEKTGSGILYNNIIEQTATKLASTKASKVKALVSAFETVISHLDGGISETDDRN